MNWSQEIKGDLMNCSSELECSYTAGLISGSPETKMLLAGKSPFEVSTLEIWGF
jgi:hypothetical protein